MTLLCFVGNVYRTKGSNSEDTLFKIILVHNENGPSNKETVAPSKKILLSLDGAK